MSTGSVCSFLMCILVLKWKGSLLGSSYLNGDDTFLDPEYTCSASSHKQMPNSALHNNDKKGVVVSCNAL